MDSVGNILAEREHDRLPFGAGISLAVLLHVGVAAGLLASALGRPIRFVNPRAVSVRLMPAGALSGGATVSVPAQAAPEPEPQKPRIEKVAEPPPPPPSSHAVLLPAKEKKPQAAAPSARATPARKTDARAEPAGDARGTATGSTINAAGSGVGIGGARLDQPDFQYSYYIERMIMAVGVNWFKPAQVVPVEPVVRFHIERDGTIADPEIETSSGLPFVDRAALRAVMAASPLPPLPTEYAGSRLGVHLIFEK
jgi:TonB family protein